MPGLVPGDHALLVVVHHLARLEPGDHPLEGVVEVGLGDEVAALAAGEDRRLVAEVGEVGAGQARGVAGDALEVDVLGERLAGGVDSEDLLAAAHVGRRHEHLAVEAARPQERLVELVEHVRGCHHDDGLARLEPVHLDQQLVQGLVALAGDVGAALGPDRVELVDEDDRGRVLARFLEEAPDSRRAEPGEHLHERRGGLAEELGARLVGDGLGQERLAGTGRAVQQDALRHLRAQPLEPLRVGEEVDDLAQLVLGLLDAGDVVPGDRGLRLRADLLRLRARHQLQRAPHEVDDHREQEDRRPRDQNVVEELSYVIPTGT